MDKTLVYFLETLLLITVIRCDSFTFFGGKDPAESMVTYSNWNAREKATLNFQFKTAKENGLLFYIHGKTKESYLKLTIDNGRLVFVVSHSNVQNIAEEFGTDLNDMNWHNVTVTRNHRATLLDLDGTQRIMTKLNWKKVLDLTSDLYLGNAPGLDAGEGFIGCIKDPKYGEGYKELTVHRPKYRGSNTRKLCYDFCSKVDKPDCNGGTCVNQFINYTCECFGTGYEGKRCKTQSKIISLLTNMDFISKKVNSMRSLRSNKMYVRFKTLQRHGILLTLGKANDYFTLEIYEGRARVETNVGGGKIVIESDRPLHDGEWHDIKVTQNGADFTLVVDHRKESRFEETKSSPHGHVDSCCLGSDIAYFGGHFNPITVIGSRSKQGFVGCLQQFYLNTVNVIQDTIRTMILKNRNGGHGGDTEIDGKVETKCDIIPRPIPDVVTLPKTNSKEKKTTDNKRHLQPTIINGKLDRIPEASTIQQTPQSGKRANQKLEKSSVAWITAGLVIGALVIILVMAFLIHRFRKKYRGTFMAPRDENGRSCYSSVQATYHMHNGIGKRQGKGNATDV